MTIRKFLLPAAHDFSALVPAALLLLCASFTFSPAQEARSSAAMPPAVVGIISLEKVERGSVAWESLRRQVNERRMALQQEIEKLQKGLEEKARQIESQRNLLSQEALAEKAREFQKERDTLQQQANLRKQQLDAVFRIAHSQIRAALNEVLVELVKERGLNMVLVDSADGSAVYFAKNELFLNDVALERLNKRIQTVVLPDEKDIRPASGG